MNVLLLSAYAANSHMHWQHMLAAMFPRWQWESLTLPPRHFSWRVRGNPLYWSVAQRDRLEQDYDLLVATSMVDLATLRGLVPELARLPSLLYFHENQFDYPRSNSQSSLLEAQMVSLYSALAADCLAFNSAYNRDTFLVGLDALLRKLPDRVPPGVVEGLAAKARVLPVPVDLAAIVSAPARWPGQAGDYPERPARLVWTGRFEHDKGGDSLWHTLVELERVGLEYELAVTGQQFRTVPAVFGRIEKAFSHRLVQFGYIPSALSYRALLRGADMVLSTAMHEFQGLAVLEAVAAGCLPAVPDRQAYPEIYPSQFRYDSHPDDPALDGRAAAGLLCRLAAGMEQPGLQPPDVGAFDPGRLRLAYAALLETLPAAAG